MSVTAERSIEHLGQTKGISNHDHDIIHELSKRLDGLWRYDQYIANAEGHSELQEMWKDLKEGEQRNVNRLKEMIKQHVEKHCFDVSKDQKRR